MTRAAVETERQRNEAVDLIRRYPLARTISAENLATEIATVERLAEAPPGIRFWGYLKLSGPGFIVAAETLGAGTLMSAMLAGANFGYRTLWIIWLAMGLGCFILAASARFTCQGGFRVVALQNRYHGYLVGSGLTALGVAFVGVVFNFGQYALATHLIESLTTLLGFGVPRTINWVFLVLFTSWLTLLYGRSGTRGVHYVEVFMKGCVLVMLISFGATLAVVGVSWREFFKGVFIPWLPRGAEGVTIFIASASAAIGVMDWLLFHYAGLARGWGARHETLARFDIVVGSFLPFVFVNFLVIAAFAETLHRLSIRPDTAQELAQALAPALGAYWSQILFYVGVLALPISTTVGMSIATAIAIHEAFGWEPDTSSLRWKITALLPQIGFLAVWYGRPLWLIILIGAFLSVTKNFAGWSFYLLLNDRRALGEMRCKSYVWNLGVVLEITLLNCLCITYILSRAGLWPE
ncbi:MAG: divalent metal cation transporter [Acidobacteria bacterium]|nr:divalent metal cation transporter [Acidobacteriota bacterium]